MARGWESKSVEAQQEEAGARRAVGPAVSPEERERRQRAESVGLALADLTAQLQSACRPVHRDMLRRRISALQALLAETAPAATDPPGRG